MFNQQYTEFELIGRGNFGTAHLVRSKSDQRVYVAKKIVLAALKDKEQEDALRESSLLSRLIHPHIVAYKESFSENGTLVIVMEYCEEGDLSFHIKRKKQREEHFPEKVILNWFLQCAMALSYIHQSKVLHRDIKSSNIFVTSNGYVKIGDFGISRVLENTYDSANTVVGTPYYMSPEVCENKPYTYKSDVWALGCVLYELCTLKHAFDANNLLGLVYKIVKDQVPDIPNHYSKELQQLVKKLLCKNDSQRPLIKELFQIEFIQREMQEFIKNNGKPVGISQIPIKRTQTHQDIERMIINEQGKTNKAEETMQTLKSDYMNTMNTATVKSMNYTASEATLTPAQRMKLKKEQQNEQQRELLAQAAKDNVKNNQQSKQKRIEDLAGSNSAGLKPSQKNQSQIQTSPHKNPSQNYNSRQNFDQTEKSQTLVSQYESTSAFRQQPVGGYDFDQTVQSHMEQTLKSDTVFVRAHEQQAYLSDERPIAAQKVTNSQLDRFTNAKQRQIEEYGTLKTDVGNNATLGTTLQYADEEFEEYYSDEELDKPRLTEQAGESEVKDVVSLYKSQLNQTQNQKTQQFQSGPGLEEIREATAESWSTATKDSTPIKPNNMNRVVNLRKSAITKFGADQFNKIYSFMSHHRQKGTPEDQLAKSLIEMLGKPKYHDCQIIDEIIFLESFQK